MERMALILLMAWLPCQAAAGSLRIQDRVDSVRGYRQAREHSILREFMALLSLPNVASDRENIRLNANLLMKMMERRNLRPQLLEAQDASVPPVVYGEMNVQGATRTLIFYAHYDGQPTDPAQWTKSMPWQPVLRSAPLEAGGQILSLPAAGEPIDPEWRLYARSASDDKAGVIAILTGLDALLASRISPSSNLKFFFEGEEEAGSPHLAEILTRYRELLRSDAWIICDGPVHQSGRKQVVFGVRGFVGLTLTVYGAKRPLHSGHYGNWAPNPAMLLAKLLSSMKDDAGRVRVAGFYKDVEPLGESERRALAEAPKYDDELMSQLGFARAEGGGKSLLELLTQPSLNIDGISSAEVGARARNIIPTTATATLDMRLVKGNDYRRQLTRLIDHIKAQGYYVTAQEPTDEERRRYPLLVRIQSGNGYNAERTSMSLPLSRDVVEAVQSVSAQPVVKMPTLGGSLPLSIFRESLNATTITVPIANYDNNQHAENENIRLQNLWDGIEIMAAIMSMKPQPKP